MSSKAKPLVVLNIVGLTPSLLGKNTPQINRVIDDGFLATLDGVFPAVTCTAQASMLTGKRPTEHGIVANGWYFRDLAEVWLWRQSNHLIKGEKVWEQARREFNNFSCAKMFWWYNMYSSADYSVTPRPLYPADGRKIPGIYTAPSELKQQLEEDLGPFPMFNFWGPAADIRSSEWIAASAKKTFDLHQPTLSLVYLPHLDYNLQRLGPNDPAITEDVAAIDRVAGDLIDHFRAKGAEVMIVSEYGIEPAHGHIHINQILRENGYLTVQQSLSWELLDAGASRAFAVADHQVAHVYITDPSDISKVRRLLEQTPGIEHVLGSEEKTEWGVAHERSGELIAIAEPNHWFTYYYWLDENSAPDFATSVDIHRKPGYDPVELFLDPTLHFPKLKIGWRLLQKQLGFRMLMDVIPLTPNLVKGTHGRLPDSTEHGPLLISSRKELAKDHYSMLDIKEVIIKHLR